MNQSSECTDDSDDEIDAKDRNFFKITSKKLEKKMNNFTAKRKALSGLLQETISKTHKEHNTWGCRKCNTYRIHCVHIVKHQTEKHNRKNTEKPMVPKPRCIFFFDWAICYGRVAFLNVFVHFPCKIYTLFKIESNRQNRLN